MTRYIAHKFSSKHSDTYFVQVGDLIHVSRWSGDDMSEVRALTKEAARVEWRALVHAGAKVAPSSTVSPLFHGVSRRHVPTDVVAAAYAELKS